MKNNQLWVETISAIVDYYPSAAHSYVFYSYYNTNILNLNQSDQRSFPACDLHIILCWFFHSTHSLKQIFLSLFSLGLCLSVLILSKRQGKMKKTCQVSKHRRSRRRSRRQTPKPKGKSNWRKTPKKKHTEMFPDENILTAAHSTGQELQQTISHISG